MRMIRTSRLLVFMTIVLMQFDLVRAATIGKADAAGTTIILTNEVCRENANMFIAMQRQANGATTLGCWNRMDQEYVVAGWGFGSSQLSTYPTNTFYDPSTHRALHQYACCHATLFSHGLCRNRIDPDRSGCAQSARRTTDVAIR